MQQLTHGGRLHVRPIAVSARGTWPLVSWQWRFDHSSHRRRPSVVNATRSVRGRVYRSGLSSSTRGLWDELDCAFWECHDLLATEFEAVDLFVAFEVHQSAADGGFGGVERFDDIALPEATVVRVEEHDDSVSVGGVWVVELRRDLDGAVSWGKFGRD